MADDLSPLPRIQVRPVLINPGKNRLDLRHRIVVHALCPCPPNLLVVVAVESGNILHLQPSIAVSVHSLLDRGLDVADDLDLEALVPRYHGDDRIRYWRHL